MKPMSRSHILLVPLSALLAFFLLLLPTTGLPQQQTSVLDPENANEARLNRLLPPEKIMDLVGITPGMVAAEIGAGRGRFVVHLAVRVGGTGKVYAEDIDETALKHLEKRCAHWGLSNVTTILGQVKDPKLPPGESDLLIVVSSYHHFEDPVALLRNARPALKPEGRLAVVEWVPWNKNDREGTTAEDMEAEMEAAGYRLIRTESLDVAKPLRIYIFRPLEEQRMRSALEKMGENLFVPGL